jgi:hypothetical protein
LTVTPNGPPTIASPTPRFDQARAVGVEAQQGRQARPHAPRALDVDNRATLRELSRQAHGPNLDLAAALLAKLATGTGGRHGRRKGVRPVRMSA